MRFSHDRLVRTAPRGLHAMGVFLLFGTLMAFLAGTTLAWPGTALDRIWELNPRAHHELAPFGRVVGIPFLLLAATMATAALGWFKRRIWGWRLAVAIIGTQVLGNLVNIFRGEILAGGIGLAVAGAMLLYLLRGGVRMEFPSPIRDARKAG